MANAVRTVAIRQKAEGGAEVVTSFKNTEDAGVKAQNAVAAATEKATASAERQVQKLREVASAVSARVAASPMQAQIDRLTGVTGGTNARAEVAARTLFAADDAAAARAARLRAEIDPLWAATERYNAEVAEMNALQKRGAISTLELARAQELAKGRLDATTAALGRNARGLTRLQAASRLNLTRQAADVAVTAAMGMNPAMIAMQQGPQILDALATSGIAARGSLLLLGGAFGLVAGAATTAFLAWQNGEGQALALERAVTGLGRTSGLSAVELEVLALAATEQGEVSIRSAREQAAAYVSTGKIGGEVIGGLIAIGRDYAAVMGMDAEEATQSLAKAMAEPDKAARELTRQFGLLDQVTLDHIDSLVKHGDRLAAQKILLDALTDAVDGQADRIGSIESAWDAAARAVSNYWDKLGRALYTTPDERLANLDRALIGARDRESRGIRLRPGFIQNLEAYRAELLRGQLDDQRRAAANADAAENQAAQEDRDRRDRAPKSRRDRSAEREARERETRRRAEEERAATLELEISRAIGDVDHVRVLEDEAAVRRRIYELVDAEVAAGEAKTRALEEQGRLTAAREVAEGRALVVLQRTHGIEYERLLGNERFAATLERIADREAVVAAYQKAGMDAATAANAAGLQLLELEKARAVVLARIVSSAADEHRLTLARLAGREGEVALMERAARVAARAREIESRGKLNHGEGEDQARIEIGQEIEAQAEGARRSWVKGFIADIRRGGVRDALADQFEQAADRLIDRLIDSLFDMDWSGLMGGGGKKGGVGDFLGGLFRTPGRNARGTDWWSGGWTWVGEEGPELIRAPRGAQIADAARSRQMVRPSARAEAAPVFHFNYAPQYSVQGSGPEIEALRREIQAERAGFPAKVIAAVNDGLARRQIAAT